ncbi:MAG: DUF1937 family protein [Candidatus Omnitrophica bacterium]|jgi:hypothetical protein|nr:DUF1937 family protein [Candidatus Omnitrophota bacterium]
MPDPKTLIYLASPFSDPTPQVREERFHLAAAAMGRLIAAGFFIISPVVATYPLAGGRWEFEVWSRWCLSLVDRSDLLWILPLNGWRESVGIRAEVALARRINVPVRILADWSDGVPSFLNEWEAERRIEELLR